MYFYRLCLLATLSLPSLLLSLLNRGVKSESPSSMEKKIRFRESHEKATFISIPTQLSYPCAIISCNKFIRRENTVLISPGTVSTQNMCRNRNLQKSQKFVDYPLKMKNPTEFLQSFCTRDPKKSGFFDRFGHVLFSVEEVPVEGLY